MSDRVVGAMETTPRSDALCPECRDGKHRNCIGEALAADDTLVPCGCPNHENGSADA